MDNRLRQHEFGFWEVISRPTEEELSDYYANKYYQLENANYRKSYPPQELEVIRLRVEQRAARAAELSSTKAPGKLLDVGCGEGFVLSAFAAKGWNVEGIDHSRAGVEAMNPAVADRVRQGNLFSLLQDRITEGANYDLVWLGNVLEHVLDPVDLMQALQPLVARGGLLVATVPNDGNAYQEALFSNGTIPNRFWIAIPDHMSYFTATSLTRLGSATGWACRDLQADFPIDLFLAHPGSNYVKDRAQGPAAHAARLRMEQVIGASGHAGANRLYSALADVGLGRNITAYFAPFDPEN